MATLWTLIAGVFAFLVGDLFITKNQKDSLQTKVDAGKYEATDEPLAAQQAADAATAAAEQKKIDESAPPTSVPELSPDQVTNYWNTKK